MDKETELLIIEQTRVIIKMVELILRMMEVIEHPPSFIIAKDTK